MIYGDAYEALDLLATSADEANVWIRLPSLLGRRVKANWPRFCMRTSFNEGLHLLKHRKCEDIDLPLIAARAIFVQSGSLGEERIAENDCSGELRLAVEHPAAGSMVETKRCFVPKGRALPSVCAHLIFSHACFCLVGFCVLTVLLLVP